MDNLNELINVWQSSKSIQSIDNKKDFLNSNKQIMNFLINYENDEKKAKQAQIALALISLSMIVFFLIGSEVTVSHLIGLILIIISLSYAIIRNQTDNFPDIRKLSSLDYLLNYKKYIQKRLKLVRLNGLFVLPLLIPGLYLTFHDYFLEYGYWWLIIMYGSALIGAIAVMKAENKRTNTTLKHIEEVLANFQKD